MIVHNPLETEARRWLDLFIKDSHKRLRAATELGLIGIRSRRHGPCVRGDLTHAAAAVFPALSLSSFLTVALTDSRESVQCEAIFAIGELGGPEIASLLLDELPRHTPTSKLYNTIVRALGKIGGDLIRRAFLQQPPGETVVQSLVGLISQQKEQDAQFAQAFQAKSELHGDEVNSPQQSVAKELRHWLENVHHQFPHAYEGSLARQIL
ncbi:MAG: hypothetical protein KA314_15560 [Chloroflexi bacterium]|nr:hypothetical protein [Chloroflexota bacterium]MBP8057251.1 hypothetical protein [Chloroflexota bacterium]